MRYVVTLADFALIRRWRATFPTRGKATAVVPMRLRVRLNCSEAEEMLAPSVRPHPALRATFPLEGEGFFGGAGLYVVTLSKGDPACWRPARGAGFDCAALFGCCVRRCTRCAASLRMTRWVGWNVVHNFFGTKYSTVKLNG